MRGVRPPSKHVVCLPQQKQPHLLTLVHGYVLVWLGTTQWWAVPFRCQVSWVSSRSACMHRPSLLMSNAVIRWSKNDLVGMTWPMACRAIVREHVSSGGPSFPMRCPAGERHTTCVLCYLLARVGANRAVCYCLVFSCGLSSQVPSCTDLYSARHGSGA